CSINSHHHFQEMQMPGSTAMKPVSTSSSGNRFEKHLPLDQKILKRQPLEILQVNVGRLCNQTCRHCHVNAGPTRTELMSQEIAELCIEQLDKFPSIHTL